MCYHNGQAYPHMAERPGDACNKCTCQYQYGGYLDWSCMSVTCQPTTCENPIPPPGQCCPVCPGNLFTWLLLTDQDMINLSGAPNNTYFYFIWFFLSDFPQCKSHISHILNPIRPTF